MDIADIKGRIGTDLGEAACGCDDVVDEVVCECEDGLEEELAQCL